MNLHLSLQQRNLDSGYLSYPLPSNFLNLSISFHRRYFSGWPVTKSRRRHLPDSCLHCRCFTAPHLQPTVLSQCSVPAPWQGPQRCRRGSEHLRKLPTPPRLLFHFLLQVVLSSMFLSWNDSQRSRGQVTSGWILGGYFEMACSVVDHWPMLFHVVDGWVTPFSHLFQ